MDQAENFVGEEEEIINSDGGIISNDEILR
jgi:hypothetical protein